MAKSTEKLLELEALAEPFDGDDLEWKVQSVRQRKTGLDITIVPYVTARAIYDRLDRVCGPHGWRNECPTAGPQGGVMQGISVLIGGQWVTKWDGAENTDIEPVKGGLSSAMKRAAVLWGMGRHLYTLPVVKAKEVGEDEEGSWSKSKVDGKDTFFKWRAPVNLDEVISGRYAGKAPPAKPEPQLKDDGKAAKPSDSQMETIAQVRTAVIKHVNEGGYDDLDGGLDGAVKHAKNELHPAKLSVAQTRVAVAPIERAWWERQRKINDIKSIDSVTDAVQRPEVRSRLGEEFFQAFMASCASKKEHQFT